MSASPRILAILGLVAVFGVFTGLALALRGTGLDPALRLALTLPLAAAAIWLTLIYWRAIDEAAREAQKSAWLWGGSLGMGLGIIAVVLAAQGMFGFEALAPADLAPERLLIRGALMMVGGQLAGFFVAWAYWWWRRR